MLVYAHIYSLINTINRELFYLHMQLLKKCKTVIKLFLIYLFTIFFSITGKRNDTSE